MIDADRALRAYEDVVAVEADDDAGVYRVVTTSDVYTAVPSQGMHLCPDREYHDVDLCKHLVSVDAVRGRLDIPAGWLTVDDLDDRTDESFDLDTDASRRRLRENHTLASFDGGEEVATDGGEEPDDRADCWCADHDLPCWEHFQESEAL